MNVNLKSARRFASVLLLSVVLAGCAAGPQTLSPDLLQRMASARTRGEHEAFAAYHEKEAAAARAIAQDHRKMAKSYQAMVVGGRGSASMAAHCNSIVRLYEGIAAEFEGMAEGHQYLAKQAPP
jgi:negative regulator of sigma E activity